jgi:carboxyl-terminal processing protease
MIKHLKNNIFVYFVCNSLLLLFLLLYIIHFNIQYSHISQQELKNKNPQRIIPNSIRPVENKDMLENIVNIIEKNYFYEIDKNILLEETIKKMLSDLDEYSIYLNANDLKKFRRTLTNNFGGIGIELKLEHGYLVVSKITDHAQIDSSPIVLGDRLLAIDDSNTDGLNIEEAFNQLCGPIGTLVSLTIQHSNEKCASEKISLTRKLIVQDSVFGYYQNSDGTWNFKVSETLPIIYVCLKNFTKNTVLQMEDLLERMQMDKKKGLIIDLRSSRGGLLNTAIQTCDIFLDDGTIVTVKSRNKENHSWNATPNKIHQDYPIVLLVNSNTASSAEVLAAALQDNKRAIVIGERTKGKGTIQSIIELGDGFGAIKLTTGCFYRPNGHSINLISYNDPYWGVTPDIQISVTIDKIELSTNESNTLELNNKPYDCHGKNYQEDKVLSAAVEYLTNLLKPQTKIIDIQ